VDRWRGAEANFGLSGWSRGTRGGMDFLSEGPLLWEAALGEALNMTFFSGRLGMEMEMKSCIWAGGAGWTELIDCMHGYHHIRVSLVCFVSSYFCFLCLFCCTGAKML
jgi:hypothetical protein